jgi:glycosyltransferase involved in cell wall biosynthesis
VETSHAGSIAAAMAQLATGDKMRRGLGAAAREVVVHNYSTAKIVERYEALFADVVRA